MSIGRERYARPPRRLRDSAKVLREQATPHERMIWRALRERLPPGCAHFRRQVPLAGYVVDFCDFGARLVVEIDGNQHGEPTAIARDLIRDAVLREQGFRVLRFSNADVQRRLNQVLDTIYHALRGHERQAPRDPHP